MKLPMALTLLALLFSAHQVSNAQTIKCTHQGNTSTCEVQPETLVYSHAARLSDGRYQCMYTRQRPNAFYATAAGTIRGPIVDKAWLCPSPFER